MIKFLRKIFGLSTVTSSANRVSEGISKCCGVAVLLETEEDFDGSVTVHNRCSRCRKELFPLKP